MIPALAVLMFARTRGARRVLGRALPAALVPLLAVLALESTYYAAHHDGMRHSLAPAHLTGKAAMIDVSRTDATTARKPEDQPLLQALEAYGPVRRLVAEAPERCRRNACLGACVRGATRSWATHREERALATARDGQAGELLRVAWERISNGIDAYRMAQHASPCVPLDAGSGRHRRAGGAARLYRGTSGHCRSRIAFCADCRRRGSRRCRR